MPIGHISAGDVESENKINQAIDKINEYESGKLDNTASSGHVLGRWSAGDYGSVQQLEVTGGLETGTQQLRIADGGVNTAKLANKAATNAKLADMATKTYKGRTASGTGAPQDLSVSQMKSDLGITAVEQAINEEELARQYADQALQEEIDAKASDAALTDEAGARAAEDAKRPLYAQAQPPIRPGEVIRFFTEAIDGEPESLTPLPDTDVASSQYGKVAKIAGAGTIAPLGAWRIEPGHLYRVRFVVRRAEDTEDPANDAVRLGVRWLGSSKAGAGTTELANILDLTVADGRVEYVFTLATADASDVDAVPLAGGIYFRPFIRTFGSGVTHVEVIQVVDATDAVVWSPDVELLQREIASLTAQIQTLSDRVQTLES